MFALLFGQLLRDPYLNIAEIGVAFSSSRTFSTGDVFGKMR